MWGYDSDRDEDGEEVERRKQLERLEQVQNLSISCFGGNHTALPKCGDFDGFPLITAKLDLSKRHRLRCHFLDRWPRQQVAHKNEPKQKHGGSGQGLS